MKTILRVSCDHVCCVGFAVESVGNFAEVLMAAHSYIPPPLKQVSIGRETGMPVQLCPPPSLLGLPPPSSSLTCMCNMKLICASRYLTGATDGESILFLLKYSMELTLNLSKTNLI